MAKFSVDPTIEVAFLISNRDLMLVVFRLTNAVSLLVVITRRSEKVEDMFIISVTDGVLVLVIFGRA